MGRKRYINSKFKDIFREKLFLKESASELADLFQVRRQTIYDWESGKSFPDMETLIKISQKCNVSVDYLLGLTEYNSLDGNYQSTSRITGLSEDAIKALAVEHDGYGAIYLNRFVESGYCDRFLDALIQALSIASQFKSDVPIVTIKMLDAEGGNIGITKYDLITLYAREMGDMVYFHTKEMIDVVSRQDISHSMIQHVVGELKSMTADQLRANIEIKGSVDFIKELVDKAEKKMNEEG